MTLLDLDFSKDIPTNFISHLSPSASDGRLFNCPARAAARKDWDASETNWSCAKSGCGAIYFHDDDVDDVDDTPAMY